MSTWTASELVSRSQTLWLRKTTPEYVNLYFLQQEINSVRSEGSLTNEASFTNDVLVIWLHDEECLEHLVSEMNTYIPR